MASKAKKQRYRIQKRFSVWVEQEIDATSLDDALAKAKTMGYGQFSDTVDYDNLPGTGVYEVW